MDGHYIYAVAAAKRRVVSAVIAMSYMNLLYVRPGIAAAQ